MNNNDDYESDVSSLDTHFRERDGDEDNLWEVEAIVAEKGSRYQVRWAGVDDKGAPWPLDWVPKEDCTDPLVRKWKKQKARKRKRDEKISPFPRKRQKLRTTTPGLYTKSSSSSKPHKDMRGEEDQSSIDQFDSPPKSHHRPRLMTCEERTESSSSSSSTDRKKLQLLPPAAMDVMNKGIALASSAAKRTSHQNGTVSTTRRPLSTFLEKRRRRSCSFELIKAEEEEEIEKRRRRSSSFELIKTEVGEDQGIESSSFSPVQALEEFEDSFVDYEGGGGGGSVSPKSNTSSRTRTITLDPTQHQIAKKSSPRMSRRQEEEEDTQDLMAEAILSSPATQHVTRPLQQQRQQRREEEEDTRDDVIVEVEFPPCSIPVDSVIASSDSQVIVVSDEDEDEDEERVNVINSPEIAPTVKVKKKFFYSD